MNKKFILNLVGIAMVAFPLMAKSAELINIEFYQGSSPTKELLTKRIRINFEDSAKITHALNDKVKEIGYKVVNEEEPRDETITIEGHYIIDGLGSKVYRGNIGRLAESSFTTIERDRSDQAYQYGSLVNVGMGSVAIGKLSPEELIKWIGAETGIANAFNNMFAKKERNTRIFLRLSSPTLYWTVEGSVRGNDSDIAELFAQVIIAVLSPLHHTHQK